MELILTRKYHEQGVNGVISLSGMPLCNTIELPWKNNKRQVSCIPEGRYSLTVCRSPRFGTHLRLENVPKRSGILIHAFNDALKESRGCIAPVRRLTGKGKGVCSRDALHALMQVVFPNFILKIPMYLTIKSEQNATDKKSATENA